MDKARRPYPEKAKDRIRQAKILNKLIKHFNGELEMTASQVQVGLKLLGKLLPDLKAVESKTEVALRRMVINAAAEDMTPEQWAETHTPSGSPSPDRKPH